VEREGQALVGAAIHRLMQDDAAAAVRLLRRALALHATVETQALLRLATAASRRVNDEPRFPRVRRGLPQSRSAANRLELRHDRPGPTQPRHAGHGTALGRQFGPVFRKVAMRGDAEPPRSTPARYDRSC